MRDSVVDAFEQRPDAWRRDASIDLVRAALKLAGLLHAHEERCELFIEALDAFEEVVAA